LRKWVAPSLATVLLLIRDPIPLAVLWIGIRDRAFPRTIGVYLWAMLALACLIAGLFVLPGSPHVVLYGLKCDFLHATMLVAAPIVLDAADLDRIIRAVIYVSVPIALLMAWQFHSPNNSWINSGLDNTFKQIDSAQGHIRPAGPFSFITGPVSFCVLLAAVLTGSAVDRRPVARPLLLIGASALIICALYSGSRSLIGGVALVIVTGLLGAFAINPRVFRRYVGVLVVVGLVGIVIGNSSMMEDSVEVFSTRISNAAQVEGGSGGFVDRYFGEFTRVVPVVLDSPLAGAGLGVGTPGGASVLAGTTHAYLLSESEWPRVVGESGPVLGLMFIAFRVYLVIWLGWMSLVAVRRGTVMAACLFGACGADLLIGHFGQATTVGFAMFTGGLCLVAAKRPNESELEVEAVERSVSHAAGADRVPA
jgi:hypothetical protein